MRKAGEGDEAEAVTCVSHSKVSGMALRLVMTSPSKGRVQGMQLGDNVSASYTYIFPNHFGSG